MTRHKNPKHSAAIHCHSAIFLALPVPESLKTTSIFFTMVRTIHKKNPINNQIKLAYWRLVNLWFLFSSWINRSCAQNCQIIWSDVPRSKYKLQPGGAELPSNLVNHWSDCHSMFVFLFLFFYSTFMSVSNFEMDLTTLYHFPRFFKLFLVFCSC